MELSLARPAYGQIRIANEMRKLGYSISPAGVRGKVLASRTEAAVTQFPNGSNWPVAVEFTEVESRKDSDRLRLVEPFAAATIVYLLVEALAWEVMPSRASVASSGCPVCGRFSSA